MPEVQILTIMWTKQERYMMVTGEHKFRQRGGTYEMKKYKAFVLIKATILILAIIPLLLEGFNHMQYKIRSPEKGLPTSCTITGYPCSYSWLSRDEFGNFYAKTSNAIVMFDENGCKLIYHLDAFRNSDYWNIKNGNITVSDIENMTEYKYDTEGEFIKKYNIINLDRIDGSNEIIDNNIIYKIDNNFIFSYIYAEINGTEKVVIKSIREDFIYLIYKIIYLTEAILYIICIIYEIKYKRKNKKIK